MFSVPFYRTAIVFIALQKYNFYFRLMYFLCLKISESENTFLNVGDFYTYKLLKMDVIVTLVCLV